MIGSINALIWCNGKVVRTAIARPETVVRYLQERPHVADYQVAYWQNGQPRRVTGEGFLALYEAGRLPTPSPRARTP